MYPLNWEQELARERIAEAHEEAEMRRLIRTAKGHSLRARLSRKLFEAAVAVEREEAWRAVWDRLEAPRHS